MAVAGRTCSASDLVQKREYHGKRSMLFQLRVAPLPLAVVGAHGVTDFDVPGFWVEYAACLLTPLPDPMVTLLFVLGSLLHFCDDLGPRGSGALHSALIVVGVCFGLQAAFDAMVGYLTLVHVPSHYARCAARGRFKALWFAGACTVAGYVAAAAHDARSLPLGTTLQRIVLAHILCEHRANRG